jgi:hypothetical protein
MKLITNLISTVRPVRFLLTAFTCTILFFSTVNPAFASYTPMSKPTDGTTQLNKIDDKAQQEIDNPAMDIKEIEKRAKNGLNEVQGAADKGKMYTSTSSKPTIAQKIEKALDKVIK